MIVEDDSFPLLSENAVERDVAVIDVGSNSVRLVHFRLEGRALWPVYNEKVMAGLGAGVRDTGRLNPDGVGTAHLALKRFQRLLDAKNVRERHAVATAAVRNAADGPQFVADVADLTGLKIRTLTGREEGEISALGLVMGIPGAHGVMGDLGGSSLELTPLVSGVPGEGRTSRLGPQEAMPSGQWDPGAAKALVDERLAKADFLKASGGAFYAVGGAWRALAQLAFTQFKHPIRVVHEYRLSAAQALEIADLAANLSAASLAGTPGLSQRRIATLPYAALLLSRIIERGRFDEVVFSAYGLREGVVMGTMGEIEQAVDPLIAGAEALARPATPTPDFGKPLARWLSSAMEAVEPAFTRPRDRVLLEAATRLADLGARLHPDHRTELSRDSVLYAPFAGITHAERAFLAGVIHFRYGGRRRVLEGLPVFQLLEPAQMDIAQMLGTGLRLGAKLSGRSTDLLNRFDLRVEAETIELEVDESVHDLYVERCVSQLSTMAGAIGRTAEVRYR